MEGRRTLRSSKSGSTQTERISKNRRRHSGTLSSDLSLTSSRLRRNIADIYAMTKMGNKLLEKGLYLSGNCSYGRRSSPSSSTTTLNTGILTPVDCKIQYIPPYARARALQWWFADRRWVNPRTHTKFFGTHDDRHPRAAGRTNPKRFTFPSPARYSEATRCSHAFAGRHPRTLPCSSIHWEDRPVFWELRSNLTGGTRRIRWSWTPWDNRQRI